MSGRQRRGTLRDISQNQGDARRPVHAKPTDLRPGAMSADRVEAPRRTATSDAVRYLVNRTKLRAAGDRKTRVLDTDEVVVLASHVDRLEADLAAAREEIKRLREALEGIAGAEGPEGSPSANELAGEARAALSDTRPPTAHLTPEDFEENGEDDRDVLLRAVSEVIEGLIEARRLLPGTVWPGSQGIARMVVDRYRALIEPKRVLDL